MNKKVEELVRDVDKQLAWLHETTEHGKAFLSPNIREQIINVFLSHPDLALIDRGKEPPKCPIAMEEGLTREIADSRRHSITQYHLAQLIMLEANWKSVIPLAEALKE